MDTNHHKPAWGVALAALLLTLTAGCGSDVASAPADISDPVDRLGEPAGPKSGSADQQCKGAPQRGGFVCDTEEPLIPVQPAPPVYLGV